MKVSFKPISPTSRKGFRRILGAATFGLLCVLLYLTAGILLAGRSAVLSEEGAHYRERELREQYLLDVGRALLETKSEQDQLRAYFVDDKNVADFLGRIESVGRRVGLSVDTTSLGVRDGVLHVESNVVGGYGEVVHFASLVEAMPHKLSIEKMSLTHTAGEWSATIVIHVHSFLP